MVVLGRGVGFGQLPYELTDMSVVYRTFYDVDPKYFDVVGSLPQDVVLASADIIEQAESESSFYLGRPYCLCHQARATGNSPGHAAGIRCKAPVPAGI